MSDICKTVNISESPFISLPINRDRLFNINVSIFNSRFVIKGGRASMIILFQ
jgi:hypothetical protein